MTTVDKGNVVTDEMIARYCDVMNGGEHPLYVIYSDQALSDLHKILSKYDSNGVGPIRIDLFKGEETNRTICLLSKEVYVELEKYNGGPNNRKIRVSKDLKRVISSHG